MINKKRSLIIILILALVLPLAVFLVKQRQEIRKKAAVNDIRVFLASSALKPNGTASNNAINVTPGSVPIRSGTFSLTYDASKITVTNFHCNTGANFLSTETHLDTTPGNQYVRCSKVGGEGVTGNTFAAVTFDIAAGSSLGDVILSLGTETKIIDSSDNIITSQKYPATLKVATEIPVFFSFVSSAVSPGASTVSYVEITAVETPVYSGRVVINYDYTKVTISSLDCESSLPSKPQAASYGTGTAEINCSVNTGQSGLVNGRYKIARFTTQAKATAQVGSVNISLSTGTRLLGLLGAVEIELPISKTPGAFQIVQAGATPTPTVLVTPTPTATTIAGNYFTPTCAVRSSTQITASGSGFGSSGNVILVTPAGGTANIAIGDIVSWSDTAVLFKVSSGFPFGQYDVKINSISLSGRLTVADSCVVTTPMPTATVAVTPTPTTVAGGTPTPTATAVAGNTFTFKLKFYAINAKPTTPPNIAGLDYGHETARVTIKSGTTVIYTYPVTLNAGDGGVYTSVPVVLADMRTTPFGSFPAGTYNLYVKPVGYYQKRFAGKAIPSGEVIDLTSSNYRFEPGDLNNDGVINLTDLNEIVNFIKTTDQSTVALAADKYKKYDYDRNGIVNAGDAAGVIETMNHRYDDE